MPAHKKKIAAMLASLPPPTERVLMVGAFTLTATERTALLAMLGTVTDYELAAAAYSVTQHALGLAVPKEIMARYCATVASYSRATCNGIAMRADPDAHDVQHMKNAVSNAETYAIAAEEWCRGDR